MKKVRSNLVVISYFHTMCNSHQNCISLISQHQSILHLKLGSYHQYQQGFFQYHNVLKYLGSHLLQSLQFSQQLTLMLVINFIPLISQKLFPPNFQIERYHLMFWHIHKLVFFKGQKHDQHQHSSLVLCSLYTRHSQIQNYMHQYLQSIHMINSQDACIYHTFIQLQICLILLIQYACLFPNLFSDELVGYIFL